jgi:hypothetical protein
MSQPVMTGLVLAPRHYFQTDHCWPVCPRTRTLSEIPPLFNSSALAPSRYVRHGKYWQVPWYNYKKISYTATTYKFCADTRRLICDLVNIHYYCDTTWPLLQISVLESGQCVWFWPYWLFCATTRPLVNIQPLLPSSMPVPSYYLETSHYWQVPFQYAAINFQGLQLRCATVIVQKRQMIGPKKTSSLIYALLRRGSTIIDDHLQEARIKCQIF